MSDNYVIEVRAALPGLTVQAGIIVREGSSFRFFAATQAFNRLEGQLFDTPKAAEKAALRLLNEMRSLPSLRRDYARASLGC